MENRSLEEYERRFREAGLVSFCRRPHLRPTTALVLLSMAVVAGEALVYLDLPVLGAGMIGLIVAISVGLAGIVLQRLEHRVDRPFARGLTEMGFIIGPACGVGVALNWGDAVEIAAANLVLLVAYTLEERLGVRFVVAWAARFAWRNLREGWRSLWRTVPLLAVVLLALFFASETWQVAARAGWWTLLVIGGGLAGGAMLIGGLSFEGFGGEGGDGLRRSERVNISALAAVATGVFSAMAAAAFAVLLFAMGALLMTRDMVGGWTGLEVSALELGAPVQITLTWELVKTVALIASVAAFVFSATLGSSETYRNLSAEALRGEMQSLLQDRSDYLKEFELERGD